MRSHLHRLLLPRNPNPSSVFKSRSPIHAQFSSPVPDLRRPRGIRSILAADLRTSGAARSRSVGSGHGGRGMAAAAADGSAARGFWLRLQKEAMLAAYTPFVVRLAAGRLELETLRQCVAQDVHFLRALVSAYELAEECADDDDARAEICELRKAVLKELKSHSLVLEEWGIDSTKEIGPTPTAKRYTDFLLATAAGKVEGVKGAGKIVTPFEKTKIAAYTLGAIAPITRLYAFLGKELQTFLNFDENGFLYKKWINNYSSESYEAAAVQIEELLDKLSVSLTGEELEVIEKLYHRAIKLEIEFFSAQPVQPAVVPLIRLHDPVDRLVIFCDFDLTCTLVDSSAILAEIAILKASKGDDNISDSLIPRRSSIDMRNSWNALSRQYTEEYEQCIESLLPKEEAKTFDYEALYNGLKQLTSFEKQANSRVVESGMLSGMNIEEIKRAGERLILLDGCTDFFQKVVKIKKELNADLHVLSYCWCADLIRSAFSSDAKWNERPEDDKALCATIEKIEATNTAERSWRALLVEERLHATKLWSHTTEGTSLFPFDKVMYHLLIRALDSLRIEIISFDCDFVDLAEMTNIKGPTIAEAAARSQAVIEARRKAKEDRALAKRKGKQTTRLTNQAKLVEGTPEMSVVPPQNTSDDTLLSPPIKEAPRKKTRTEGSSVRVEEDDMNTCIQIPKDFPSFTNPRSTDKLT